MLSDEMIAEIGEACGLGCKVADAGYPCDMLWFDGNPTPFARAIESEVRKQDTALIRQLVDALEHATAWAEEWRFAPAWVADAQAAICVAGVWLEGKP